ncbi:hypothetical protein, partial [Escherichia coli]|uniref:hypothetical protein n=1 Tax=Escherichia coli TaxID=562 RepID=UPI003A4D4134
MTNTKPASLTVIVSPDTANPTRGRLRKRNLWSVSYTHLRAHETCADRVCRLLLEKGGGGGGGGGG